MAEYFPTRREAEEFIQEWYAKDGKPPVFFGKIFNNGAEKWIVNYDARQNPRASPHIKVLEDHSEEIRTIVAAPRPVKPPQPETLYQIGDDYRDRERQRQKELRERRQKVAPDALRRFPLKKQSAFSVSFAPDGSLVAAGQYGYVNVWDVETGDVVTEIKASENAVHPVRFSPDGLVLAAGSYASYPYTGEVTLWSPTSGERLGKVQNDSGDMGHSFGLSLDGHVLALGSKDRRVHLFDVESGRRKNTITATKYVANSIAFAPPGLMLIAGVVPRQEHDSRVIPGIEIWDSTTFKPIRTLEAIEGFYLVGGLAVSPDGSMLAAGLSGNGGLVLLWDMKTFARTTLAGYKGAVESVGFSSDGKYLAAGCDDKRVRVWDLTRSEFKGQLQPLEEKVASVAFAPDGRFFAAGPAGGGTSTLWVWPSDTVVNFRATEKGLDGADLHGKRLDNPTAGAALTHLSKGVDSQRRDYIMSCLMRIKESEDPLERMCAAGHADQTELMRFLIEQCQGDVNYKNDKGRTQLHSAARWGYPETVKLFLKYARDVNARDNDAMTPLMCCAEAGREFISYDDENGRHIFGPYGKPDGHIETIRVLIGAGADVNARNNKGATAAAIAAEKKFSDIVAALSAGGTGAPLRSENRKSDGLFRRLSRKIFGSSKSDASLKPWPRAANEVHYDPTGQSQNTPPAFEFQIEEGGAITNMAVQHRMFAAGEGKAFLVTFLSPAPTLRLAGDSDNYIEVRGQLTCNPPCFLPVPFEIEFSGPSGGGELHCNACGSGYGLGFGYRRADDQWNGKIDPTGFFFWFTPHTRGPDNEFVMHGLRVQRLEVKLLSEK